MAKGDGEERKERQAGRTFKSSDVHRRTSSFKAIRGLKQPADEAAPAEQDFQQSLRMTDAEIDEVMRPVSRPRWDERAGRYRDVGQSAQPSTALPEQASSARLDGLPTIDGGEPKPEEPAETVGPSQDGDAAPALDEGAGRMARRPYARRAGDAFMQSHRGFDAENAPEVPPLGEGDFDDDGQWVEDGESDDGAPTRIRRVGALEKPKRRVGRIFAAIIAVLLLALLVVFGIFSWNRWLRFNDTGDFQGQWYADGTSTPITVDADTIRMTSDVAYLYELDTTSKTLTFSFGKLEGHAHYWFEDDRSRLVIVDGENYTVFSTFIEDFQRTVTGFVVQNGGSNLQLPEGQGVIVLSRTATEPAPKPSSSSSSASAEPAEPAEGQKASGESALPEGSGEPAEGEGESTAEPGSTEHAEGQGTSSAVENAQQAEVPASTASASSSGQSSQNSAGRGRQMLSVSDIIAERPSSDDVPSEG